MIKYCECITNITDFSFQLFIFRSINCLIMLILMKMLRSDRRAKTVNAAHRQRTMTLTPRNPHRWTKVIFFSRSVSRFVAYSILCVMYMMEIKLLKSLKMRWNVAFCWRFFRLQQSLKVYSSMNSSVVKNNWRHGWTKTKFKKNIQNLRIKLIWRPIFNVTI